MITRDPNQAAALRGKRGPAPRSLLRTQDGHVVSVNIAANMYDFTNTAIRFAMRSAIASGKSEFSVKGVSFQILTEEESVEELENRSNVPTSPLPPPTKKQKRKSGSTGNKPNIFLWTAQGEKLSLAEAAEYCESSYQTINIRYGVARKNGAQELVCKGVELSLVPVEPYQPVSEPRQEPQRCMTPSGRKTLLLHGYKTHGLGGAGR